MSDNYSVGVWDVQYYKVDESGTELLNEDGSTKLFRENGDVDYWYLTDSVCEDDLVEAEVPDASLMSKVLDQIVSDVNRNDLQAIEGLLSFIPVNQLRFYLPED